MLRKNKKSSEEDSKKRTNETRHKRQNSATLRKYRNVYESVQNEKCKKESENNLSQKMEKMKVKKEPVEKVKKEPVEKVKKPLNSYQLFFKEQRLAGKTPKEIGVLWRNRSNSTS